MAGIVQLSQLPEIAELREVLRRCNKKKPKAEDVAALQRLLRDIPDLWRAFGDMAAIAESHLIDSLDATVDIKESLRFGMEVMPKELGFTEAAPLEKMLIRRVVLCWVRLQLCEYQYTSNEKEGRTLAQGNYWEKRLSAVQGHYLRALTTLARIRKMQLPTMQVNIATEGGQQVNIANQCGPGPPGPQIAS